jgi:hypothetical protein
MLAEHEGFVHLTLSTEMVRLRRMARCAKLLGSEDYVTPQVQRNPSNRCKMAEIEISIQWRS